MLTRPIHSQPFFSHSDSFNKTGNTISKTLFATAAIITILSIAILLISTPKIFAMKPLTLRITGISLLSLTTGVALLYFLFAKTKSPHSEKSKNEQLVELARRCTKDHDLFARIRNLSEKDTETIHEQCLMIHQQGNINLDLPQKSIFELQQHGRHTSFLGIRREELKKLKLSQSDMLILAAGTSLHFNEAVFFTKNQGGDLGIIQIGQLKPKEESVAVSFDETSIKAVRVFTSNGFTWIDSSYISKV